MDRLLLLWALNASSLQCTTHGPSASGVAIISAWDIKNAFPSMWQDGVDHIIWPWTKGVRGKIWRICRNMERNLSGKVRINGHYIQLGKYMRGGNQGAVSMPHRWKYLVAPFMEMLVDNGAYTQIAGTPVPGFAFVDDFSLFSPDLSILALQLNARAKFATMYGVDWAPAKDQYLIRGTAAAKNFTDAEFEVLTGSAALKNIKILGEIIGKDPSRCKLQVTKTLKGVAAAAGSIEWLRWKGTAATPAVVLHLFQALVQSVACSHLVLSDTLDSELDTLDAVKTSLGRRLLGVSPLTSKWAVLGELGWFPFRSAVLLARLLFLGRLFRREEGSLLATLLEVRLAQLDATNAPKSFLASLRGIMMDLGLSSYWSCRPFPTKGSWKRLCKAAIRDSDIKQWEAWRDTSGPDNGFLNLTKHSGP